MKEVKEIEQAVVIDKKKENGEKYLVGYYISKTEIENRYIKEYLRSKIPLYMVPNYYIKIEEIPLTNNGKLDRRRLPEPRKEDIIIEQYIAPENEIEQKICNIFSEVLNYPENEIGRMSDFYEFGGDSLNAIRVSSRIEKELNIRINIKDILETPVVYELGELIEKLMADENNISHQVDIIERRNVQEFPITSQQMGVYLDSIKHPDSLIYNVPFILKLKENINIDKIKEGFNKLLEKQEILKSKYVEKQINEKIEIVGVIDKNLEIEFEEYENSTMKKFVRPFNLSKGPLIRVGIVSNSLLMIDMHHIICDGTTISIIKKELNKYYENGIMDELEVQFSDYAMHIEDKKNKGLYEEQFKFYQEMFNENYNILILPQKEEAMNSDNNNSIKMNSRMISKIVNKEYYKKIEEYVKNNSISKTSLFLSIYGYVLSKYSGQDNIYTSIISANRNSHYTEDMIGMFVSTQPVLLKYGENDISFSKMIKNNMNKLIEIYNNQEVSFSELISRLKLEKVNNTFVFQARGIIQENNSSSIFDEEGQDIYTVMDNYSDELIEGKNKEAKFDITFNIAEREEDYLILIEYNESLYENSMICQILDSYIEIIRNIDDFGEEINKIEYIPEEEREKIINEFNNNVYKYELNKLYHVEFSKVAKENGDKCAIICNGDEISYKQLDEMSNSISHYLRKQGISRKDIIPIICERSYYYVIGAIGIMKAGGAFLPIDPEFPEERIKYTIEEVKAKIVLTYITNEDNKEKIRNSNLCPVYEIDKHEFSENIDDIQNINETDDICYCLFTSGTTGKPKGCLINHNNLINYSKYTIIKRNNGRFFEEAKCNWLFQSLHLISLAICNDLEFYNPKLLGELIQKTGVDYIFSVPTRFTEYMNDITFLNSIKNVKYILLGGEKITEKCIKMIKLNSSKTNLFNVYGPTETSIVCSYREIYDYELYNKEKLNTRNIGKSLCNCKMYVLDKHMKPVPIGVEGEIYVGGNGVGEGYLNNEKLTKEKFVNLCFDKEKLNIEKVYRTGDLGMWNNNGEIEILGRIDFQVKIHGQRIEISEIDNVMKEMNGIEKAVVIDKKKEDGEKYLVGYYVSNNKIEVKDIKEYMRSKLPMYMIPNYYIKIDEIPLTNNGKLDRKALPDPRQEDIISRQYVAPESELEKKICNIFSEVLNYPENEIGRMGDFFEFGGDSLNAIRISSRIEKELNIRVNIKDILEHSLVCELGKLIEILMMDKNDISHQVDVIKRHNVQEFPITSQQMGVYLDSIKHPNSLIYNVPCVLKLKDNTDIDKIKEGFNEILEKQEILKSKYVEKKINGKIEIIGIIDKDLKIEFEEYENLTMKNFVRPFNLSEGPLIRVGIVNNSLLMIDMHHIICDGTTISIIKKELNNYYENNTINELEVQFSDYALHIEDKKNNGLYEEQFKYYQEMFNENYELEGKVVGRTINKEQSKKIEEYIKNNNISKTSFFLSIYGYVLSKYSGQDNIYTSIISANRNSHYTENMIGMFVSTQPVLLKYGEENISFSDIIKGSMNKLIEIYNNQEVSFSELVSKLKLEKVNNTFVFQARGIIQENENSNLFDDENGNDFYTVMDNYSNELMDENSKEAKFDITFNIAEREEEYIILIEYNEALYENRIISKILDSYIEVIMNMESFDKTINEIEYIPENEKEKIIKIFNNNIFNYELNKLYHVEFSKVAKENAGKCAIVYNENEISYKQLDEMSNSVAHYLRKKGISRKDIIPIICERSFYYVIGAIGIMKAGGAFLPIDPEYPEERIKYIIEEVKAKIVLTYITNEDNKEKIRNSSLSLIYEINKHEFSENIDNIQNINEIEDSCYCLFTSGTTGKPKGTITNHKNLINYCLYSQTYNGSEMFTNNFEVSLSTSKFTFDMSIGEIFYPLLKNKIVVMSNEEEFNNPKLIGELISKRNVDYIFITPSRFENYIKEEIYYQSVRRIKVLIFGGEECKENTINNIVKNITGSIYNVYGPTETTVISTMLNISEKWLENNKENRKITIGKPLCNSKLYILDKYMKPVPVGVEGEIFIGGYGVGNGYLNREELTKEKFIECPFSSGNKYDGLMYRTGDIGKWTEEGEIEYSGRIDFQVKIHGQRLELSEIESVMKEIKEIEQAIVIDKKKENGEKYLVGYYINETGTKIDSKNIKDYLKRKLPLYMVPNYYVKIKEIPLSNNGKLDRKRLSEPNKEDIIMEQYIAPENEIEQKICKIFSEVLNYSENEIGRMSDFFEFGGDSLNAIRITSRIEKELNIRIKIKDIINHPIVSELGKLIENLVGNDNDISHQVDIIKRQDVQEFPVTSQQMGVYLDKGFNKLLEKQEILKSKYVEKQINEKIEIVGVIDKDIEIEFEEYENSTMKKFVRPFNLSEGPLIRVGIVSNSLLMIDMHHIICDGTTISIIKKELNKYYENDKIEELEVQFSDYALYVEDKKINGLYENQFKFYQDMFNDSYNPLILPQKEEILNCNNDIMKKRSKIITRLINKEQSRKIEKYLKKNNVSKTSFFLSIYGYILSKYSGQESIYTSIVSANRNSYYTENMIG
eukprot:jgi/Orpsp1_1/1175401/evm.model.c7180000053703.1